MMEPPPSLLHAGQHGLDGEECRPLVHRHAFVPVLGGDLGGGMPVVAGDIVYKHVEIPQRRGRRADGALQVAGIADVAALEPRFRQVAGAQPLQQRRGRPGIDVDECHTRALPAEPLHQAGADAGATAGNEHAAVPEARIHRAVRGELHARDDGAHGAGTGLARCVSVAARLSDIFTGAY